MLQKLAPIFADGEVPPEYDIFKITNQNNFENNIISKTFERKIKEELDRKSKEKYQAMQTFINPI